MMLVKVIATENEAAIPISEELLIALNVKVGDTVNIYVRSGKLVIANSSEPYYTTEELVAGITDENIHTAVDWGSPVGKELW